MREHRLVSLLFAVLVALTLASCTPTSPRSDAELDAVSSLWIGELPPVPPDPSNAVADDPDAAALGHALFFDARLSANGQVSCATCHDPARDFQDGRPLARGVGTTTRRTMTVVGTAYSPWLFWDGRKDSLWAQALGPLESAVEHGGDRTYYAHVLAQHYREDYEALFGPMPELGHLPSHAGPVPDATARANWETMSAADRDAVTRVFANLGKAIAAYERQLVPGPSRFDRYAEALIDGDEQTANDVLSEDEIAGLALFVGEARCIDCHNGPLLTNHEFHNTGVPAVPGLPEDLGRAHGAADVLADEFNCLGRYSDAPPQECGELRFLDPTRTDLTRRFRPTSLRNVAERAPYMHAGQFATLADVLAHYNEAPSAPQGRSELTPLELSDEEIAELVAFLATLSGPIDADPRWLAAPR